jgi:tetratricopeptide (TPR) repeat protein
MVHYCWGEKASFSSRFEESKHHYREAMHISSDLNDRQGMAWYQSGLGWVALLQGDYEKAKKYMEEAYLNFEAINSKAYAWRRLMNLGIIAFLMGEFEEAQLCHEEALSLGRYIGNQDYIATSIENLGNIALEIGEFEIAKEHYQDALTRFQSLGDENRMGVVINYLGKLAVALGDYQDARVKYHSALEFGLASQNTRFCLFCLGLLAESAELYKPAGNTEFAVELAALAQNHVQSNLFTRERAKKLLGELSTKLEPEIFREAKARGRRRDVQTTAEEMLILLEHGDGLNNNNI